MAGTDNKTRSGGLQDRVLIALEVAVGLAVVAAIMGKAYGPAPTVIFVLCAFAATYTGYNMFRMFASLQDPTVEVQGRLRDEQRESLEYEKRLILQGIKELEADYGIGKVDDRDYASLRKTAEDRAMGIIARLRDDDAKWTRAAEKLVAERLPGMVAPVADTPPSLPSGASTAAPSDLPASAATTPAQRAPTAPTRDADADLSSVFDNRPARWTTEGNHMKCGGCGALNDPDGHFCHACGRPRLQEPA